MSGRRSNQVIRAAGGVVLRVQDGVPEVALVHRPRYDDWSLPKGKLEPRESELAAAVREVGEELGSRVAVSRRIRTITYDVPGARKRVTYWVMRHLDGTFTPDDEVDEVGWWPVQGAADRLTYPTERSVLAAALSVPFPDAVIVLVRHAKAGKRTEWRGVDAARPLEPTGRAQAKRLSTFLQYFAPDRVISADPVRCVQTVAPLAEELGLQVIVDTVFADESYLSSPVATETALLALAKPGRVAVVASQGSTIPGLIERLVPGVRRADTRKGAAWVLSIVDGTVASADYYEGAARAIAR